LGIECDGWRAIEEMIIEGMEFDDTLWMSRHGKSVDVR
jgi:hypothetical protein